MLPERVRFYNEKCYLKRQISFSKKHLELSQKQTYLRRLILELWYYHYTVIVEMMYSSKQIVPTTYILKKRIFAPATFKDLRVVSFQTK